MATYLSSILLLVCYVDCARVPVEICNVYKSDEDLTIGGIFSIHGDLHTGDTVEKCGLLLPVSALQLTEAMVFAVDAINRDDTVLPNNSLGFEIHDDCSRAEYAMWGSLAFHMGSRPTIKKGSCFIPGIPVRSFIGKVEKNAFTMGIVGTGKSSSTEAVINVAELFKRPMVSYGATEAELNEGNPLEFYFSTISSDDHKARAIVDVLLQFNWEYIAVVHSVDNAVLELLQEVERRADERHLCMHVRAKVHEVPTQAELEEMIDTLRSNQNAQVVLLLASAAATVQAVLSAVSEVDPPFNRTWMVDSWGGELVRHGVSQKGISIEYDQPELVAFEDYFRSRVLKNKTTYNNPWLAEFCNNSDICLKSSRRGFSKSLIHIAPVIDAVFALAHFLDKTIEEYCLGPLKPCLRKRHTDDDLPKLMKNVSFAGTRGHFRFINNSYNDLFMIKQRQEDDEGVPRMVEVGYWDPAAQDQTQLKLNSTLIHWGDDIGVQPPRSSCRTKCLSNQVIEKDHADPCCSGCRSCSGKIVNGSECMDCGKKQKPNKNSTDCVDLDKTSITWGDPPAIVLVSLTSCGLLLCVVTSFGMIKYRHHALIKATSRELSTVNIIGLVLAFVSVFPFLMPPSDDICGVAQSLYALSFTLMYAPLLLKVNRIYRIFESSRKTAKRPRFTGPISQLVIVALLVIIQLILLLITAVARPRTWNSVKTLFRAATKSEQTHLEIFCNLDIRFVASMSYNVALLAACCYYAYKARNVPGNFNEARFYVASVYTTLLPIVAAVPLYCTAQKAVVLGLAITLIPITNGYITLIFVYLSTLYAITFNKVEREGVKKPAVAQRPTMLSCSQDKGSTSVGSDAFSKVHPRATRVAPEYEESQAHTSREGPSSMVG